MPKPSLKVGGFGKARRKEVWVQLREFEGSKFVDIREYYQDTADDKWKPTKKGVTLPPVRLVELRDLLEEAEEQAESAGWL